MALKCYAVCVDGYQNTIKHANKHRQNTLIISFVLSLLLLLFLFCYHVFSAHHKPDSNKESQALVQLNARVQNLQDSLATHKDLAPDVLSKVQATLEKLTRALADTQAHRQTLLAQMQQLQTQNQQQNGQLALQIHHLQHHLIGPHYLDPSLLPFHVVGLDYWNQIPKVTIRIGGDYALMMQNQSRLGWRLASINSKEHYVIFFQNPARQVKVLL